MRFEYGSARPTRRADFAGAAMRACNCIGPQNGEPRCPCMMRDHRRREASDKLLDMLLRGELIRKPRVRVKVGGASA